ncbi:hypothetical protein JVT61DRAFT_11365 [Boletus reticuloceps]|uniref:Heterokaryon incompatibility domain-containing protein n=1 Tax=Boletus reticuloceps TaxID=495285 RepID=A0A8I2YEM2_9AGAM|nr:hypothetical protein JVT61DRAFT_11365 [Boletus reticuloceps]
MRINYVRIKREVQQYFRHLGALVRSIWNTRTWTLQEYVAAKIGLLVSIWDAKPQRITTSDLEMEQAGGVCRSIDVASSRVHQYSGEIVSRVDSADDAGGRRYTLVARDFLGYRFPSNIVKGCATGRLSAHLLARSGDVSILAWTGESESFNCCLPLYRCIQRISNVPQPVPDDEMERIVTMSHTSVFDLDGALSLYDRLNELPAPWFVASRIKLLCITFQLTPLSPYRTRSGRLYRTDSPSLAWSK